MAYGKFSAQELEGAIQQTREAIRLGQEMLDIGSCEPVTKGLEKVAESMPSLIERLRDDLKKLEKAQGKGADDKAEDGDKDGDEEEEDKDDDDGDDDDDDHDDEDKD